MEPSFLWKLGLSFVVGSVWVTLSTVVAEQHGSKIGGLLGGLPSTVVVSLLFIGLTQTPEAACEASTVVPFVQGFNGLFLVVFMLLVRRGLAFGLSGALLVWFIPAGILAAVGIQRFWISVTFWILLALGCYIVVEKSMRVCARGKVSVHYGFPRIAFRALLSGILIAFSVLMGKLGGPIFGGIFAAFPAMFLSTLVITYRTGGAQFSRGMAKALLASGMINIPTYAIVVRYLYPRLGLARGTAIGLVFSCGTGYLTYLLMRTELFRSDVTCVDVEHMSV